MRLTIADLQVDIEQKNIISGLDLTINPGELHAIMGPNGSGKSTLAYTLMGHPNYTVTAGSVHSDEHSLIDLSPDKRSKLGLFLAFQYPYEIEGVTLYDFLRQSYNARYGGTQKQLGLKAFREHVAKQCELLGIDQEFTKRDLNVGFSGGEKKRAEILQLAVLQPSCAILDEIDSGLDIDALKTVCQAINTVRAHNKNMSLLIITHYQRILNYISPDFVHVMQAGKITQSGDHLLAQQLEKEGYASVTV